MNWAIIKFQNLLGQNDWRGEEGAPSSMRQVSVECCSMWPPPMVLQWKVKFYPGVNRLPPSIVSSVWKVDYYSPRRTVDVQRHPSQGTCPDSGPHTAPFYQQHCQPAASSLKLHITRISPLPAKTHGNTGVGELDREKQLIVWNLGLG